MHKNKQALSPPVSDRRESRLEKLPKEDESGVRPCHIGWTVMEAGSWFYTVVVLSPKKEADGLRSETSLSIPLSSELSTRETRKEMVESEWYANVGRGKDPFSPPFT